MCPTLVQMHTQQTQHSHDRRASPRLHTVFLMVKVTRDSDVGLFRVRNISDMGLNLVAHVGLRIGERLLIEFSEGFAVKGSVAWCEGECCGVVFDEAIDSGTLLKSFTGAKQEDRRGTIRLPVMRLATSYSEAGIHPVKITDVSPRGVGLAHRGSLRTGMFITLVLESGSTRRGAVCWSKNGHAGVLLGEPFTREELESASGL